VKPTLLTKAHSQDSTNWTGAVRTVLAPLSKDDGDLLQKLLRPQSAKLHEYPLEANEARLFEANTNRHAKGSMAVSVPDNQTHLVQMEPSSHT
jgi:hypothetical protein